MSNINKDVLTIHINVLGVEEIKSLNETVVMITFDGYAENRNFVGKIDGPGVDVQHHYKSDLLSTLSARYLLKGRDLKGNQCNIFIENNAIMKKNESLRTTPKIITDSEALAWMENATLIGEIEDTGNGLIIHIYES